jgi:hypothetical protein
MHFIVTIWAIYSSIAYLSNWYTVGPKAFIAIRTVHIHASNPLAKVCAIRAVLQLTLFIQVIHTDSTLVVAQVIVYTTRYIVVTFITVNSTELGFT